jgi:hypothetical protein
MNNGRGSVHFVVLIPHRDILPAFNTFRQKLFCGGYGGVFSFPAAAPLARVEEPLGVLRLKEIARAVRRASLRNDETGKIKTLDMDSVTLYKKKMLYGLALTLDMGCGFFFPFGKILLGIGLFDKKIESENAPVLSFRAAAVANMTLCETEYKDSYLWRVGELYWLPPVKKGKRLE